jgi:hypothetical protein
MGEAVEQCGGHFGIAKDLDPFPEGQIGGDDQRGLFVEFADQMEEQGAAGLREGQVAQLIKDDEVHVQQDFYHATTVAMDLFLFQLVDEIDNIEPAHPSALIDGGMAESQRQMGFTGPRAAD